jgi:hypothetical protein
VLSKAVLCNTSVYFTKALENGFKETEQRVLTLPDSNLESVQLFIYWTCKHELPDAVQESNGYAEGSQELKDFVAQKQESLVRLWCFADRFLITKLQDVAMTQILSFVRIYYVPADVVDLALRLTSGESKLRTGSAPKSPSLSTSSALSDRLGWIEI